MQKSESIKSIAAALAKARDEFPEIKKDREVEVPTRNSGSYRFKYATLDHILESIKKPLASNGLSFVQSVGDGKLTLLLLHSSGEWIETDAMPIKVTDGGSQAFGSAISYAKRYQLCAVFGITADDDDDANIGDGHPAAVRANGANGNGQPPRRPAPPPALASPEQVKQIKELLNAVQLPEGEVDKWFAKAKVDVWEDMPASLISRAIAFVKAKLPPVNKETGEVAEESAEVVEFRTKLYESFKERQFPVHTADQVVAHVLDKKGCKRLAELPEDERNKFLKSLQDGKLDHFKTKRGSDIKQPPARTNRK